MAYVDGQRNCAVALGERDVKTDVSNKGTERRHQTSNLYFKTSIHQYCPDQTGGQAVTDDDVSLTLA